MDLISENRRKLSAVLMRDAVYIRWAATSEFDRNIQEWCAVLLGTNVSMLAYISEKL